MKKVTITSKASVNQQKTAKKDKKSVSLLMKNQKIKDHQSTRELKKISILTSVVFEITLLISAIFLIFGIGLGYFDFEKCQMIPLTYTYAVLFKNKYQIIENLFPNK